MHMSEGKTGQPKCLAGLSALAKFYIKRKHNFFLCVVLAIAGISCQKELDRVATPTFWAITNISLTDADSGTVLGVYDFTYDSLLRRATRLNYVSPVQRISKEIYPLYGKDTVYLGTNSFIALDRSKRITLLSENNAASGIQNGDYYYNYNDLGHLKERLLDDGVSDALRTTFNYDNGDLVQYHQDIKGFPLANTAALTYSTDQPRISNFSQYSLLEIFPELLLYMPCFNMGKLVLYPLSKIDSQVSIPAPPTPPYTTYYKNFVMTAEGYISSFETMVQIGTNPPVNKHYAFTYKSFK